MKMPHSLRRPLGLAAMLAGAFAPMMAWADEGIEPQRWQLNMTPGVTETAQAAYSMHMIMLWICVAIGIIVFGAMAIAMFKFRKSKGTVADKSFTHSTFLEILWTAVPIIILVAMAWPATTRVIKQYNADHDRKPTQMTIKVTGYQWMWRYDYVDKNYGFFSRLDRKSDELRQDSNTTKAQLAAHKNYLRDVDNPLVIPADTRVRFVFTADDVIHAWWIPALGWKQDAIPGIINEGWTEVPASKVGTYRGVCAELCGKDHGFMPIVVKVVPKAEFESWIAQQTAPAAEAVATSSTTDAAPAASTVAAAPAGPVN
jgi:cytochrome c oxidase subunit II